jgi:hypothetical protein
MLFSANHAKASSLAGAAGWVCATLTCALIAGCGNGAPSAATDSSKLQFVADSYGLFLKNNRRLPNDDAEFREFVDAPPAGSPYAAYEQEGVNGRRLIADTAGNIQEVDEATFRTLVPNAP